MSHKFDAAKKHKLDNPERRKLLPPEETLVKLGLSQGDIMADIGCGIGYFSLPAAKIVGMDGKVYAIDIVEDMLADVRRKAEFEHLGNIQAVLSTENKMPLPDSSVSYVFAAFVMHETVDKLDFLAECKRLLTPVGKAAFIEWEKKETTFGPPVSHRLSREELVHVLEEAGFVNLQQISINEAMFAVVAGNNSSSQ